MIITELGVTKLRRLLEMSILETGNQIIMEEELSEALVAKRGLRQEDVCMCTVIFNLTEEIVLRKSDIETKAADI